MVDFKYRRWLKVLLCGSSFFTTFFRWILEGFGMRFGGGFWRLGVDV